MPDEQDALDLAELRRLLEAWRNGDAFVYSGRVRLNAETFLVLLDRLASAEKVLRVFAEAAEDLEDTATGVIWECPEAMNIECDDLRAARSHFARYKETGDASQD